MKVILLKDVKGKGKKDDVITVSDGYANNFLIKNQLAVMYTKGSKNVLENEISERKNAEDILVADLEKIKNNLENKNISFHVKTGKEDKVFGTVSVKQIHEKLKNMGYNIDKKCIQIEGNISTLGVHKVTIILHKRVEFNINVVLEK